MIQHERLLRTEAAQQLRQQYAEHLAHLSELSLPELTHLLGEEDRQVREASAGHVGSDFLAPADALALYALERALVDALRARGGDGMQAVAQERVARVYARLPLSVQRRRDQAQDMTARHLAALRAFAPMITNESTPPIDLVLAALALASPLSHQLAAAFSAQTLVPTLLTFVPLYRQTCFPSAEATLTPGLRAAVFAQFPTHTVTHLARRASGC